MIWKKISKMPPPAKPGTVNYSLFDRFTLVHFGIGAAYGVLGVNFFLAVLLAIGWEVLENPLKAHLPRFFPHGTKDTVRNMAGDTAAVLLGWFVGQQVVTSLLQR